MSAQFSPGDVVRLKSGSTPKMTVEAVSDTGLRVECVWFEGDTVRRGPFLAATLKAA
ncbi:MAG: DUF2158 domain-containing protein [Pseudomonadota bacterium]